MLVTRMIQKGEFRIDLGPAEARATVHLIVAYDPKSLKVKGDHV